MHSLIKPTACLTLCILVAASLQACSDKPAPGAIAQVPVVAPASVSASASAVAAAQASLIPKVATVACDEREVVVEASCMDLYGPRALACTRQSLAVRDAATGKQFGVHEFVPKKGEGDEPAIVEEKIGSLTCVRTASEKRYIVAHMSNGGNCEQCEWREVYSWDGALLGSTRSKKPGVKAVDEALQAIDEKDVDRVFGEQELSGFYSAEKQR
ncbi:MAG: hypothetical protein ACJ8GW_05330 [Massilia sp.]